MKLLTAQLPLFSRYLIPFWSKYSPTVLKHSQPMRDQVSHPYKACVRIMVLYVLTFVFLDSSVSSCEKQTVGFNTGGLGGLLDSLRNFLQGEC
jgi:hypothetical protein